MKNRIKLINKYKVKIVILLAIIITTIITFIVYTNCNKKKIIEIGQDIKVKAHLEVAPEGYIEIRTPEELETINNNLTGNYILMNDIDMTGVQFDAIGTSASNNCFKGILDGNEYKITNLNINSSKEQVGLFACISNGAVKNLTLENVNITTTSTWNYIHIGVIAGTNFQATIENVRISNVKIKGNINNNDTLTKGYFGAIVGENYEGIIRNIEVNGNVENVNNSTELWIGGIAGNNHNGTIESVTFSGSINNNNTVATAYIGGITGDSDAGKIENSITIGEIDNSSQVVILYIGGIVGRQASVGTVTNGKNEAIVKNTGNVTKEIYMGGITGLSSLNATIKNTINKGNIILKADCKTYIGGLVGYAGRGIIEQSYSTGIISVDLSASNNDIGGLVGHQSSNTVRNTYSTSKIEGNIKTGNIGGLIGYTCGEVYSKTTYNSYIENSYAIGEIAIESAEIVKGGLIGEVSSEYVVITNPYWSSETTKVQTSAKTDEQNRMIMEMLYTNNYKDWDFKNIWNIEEGKSLPYLVEIEKPTSILAENIEYCPYEGKGSKENPFIITNIDQLQSSAYFNRVKYFKLANDIDASTVDNFNPINLKFIGILEGNNHSINNITIKSKENYIGLFKQNDGTIKDLILNNINIQSSYNGDTAYIGGICAYNNGTIKNVEINGTINNIGNVTDLYLGQITGYNNSVINKTHSNVTLTSEGNVTNAYVGGIAGNNNANIIISYNTGNISVRNIQNLNIGGIAGKSNYISNAYNKGNINVNATSSIIGGIVGQNIGIIKNTYAIGNIENSSATYNLGGIAGENTSIIKSSYYNDSNITEQKGKGTLKTLDELRKQETFEEWNFNDIWNIEENLNTPVFKDIFNNDENYVDDEQYETDDFWEWHTRTTTDDQAYNGKHIVINPGKSIDFWGYGVISYKDYLYKYYTNAGNKTFMFKIDETKANYHTLDGVGFIFNSSKKDDLLSGYVLLIREQDICLYRLDNVNATKFETGTNATVQTYAGEPIASTPKSSSTTHNLIIKTSPTKAVIIDNGEEILNVNLDYSKHVGEDFGLIASYAEHNCSILSEIQFLNFEMDIEDYSVPVLKTDENNKKLSGAKFQVRNTEGEVIREGSTNSNGIYNIKGLQEGIYTVEEIEAPAKYTFKNNTRTFKVTNDGKVLDVETNEEIEIKFVNEALKFVVKVVDSNGNPIPNSQVNLYDGEGNEILGSDGQPITVTTIENGTAIVKDIEAGTYTFKQTGTPSDYVLNNTVYTVTISKDGMVTFTENTEGIIINNKYGNITINNYEEGTTDGIEGTVIGICDSNGNLLTNSSGSEITFTTNSNGKINFKMPSGTYYYKQVSVKNGYTINNIIYGFSVTDDGTVTFIEGSNGIIYNKKETIEIEVSKVWVDTEEQRIHRPEKIKIQALNGETVVDEKEISSTETKVTFTLPKYDTNGNEITYRVVETEVNTGDLKFYTSNVEGNTITNTFTVPEEKVNLAVTKVWEDNSNSAGKRPESVIIVAKSGENEVGQVELTVANALEGNTNTWQGQIGNLPKYDSNGNEIVYTIDEKEVTVGDLSFYTKTINGNTIINTLNLVKTRYKVEHYLKTIDQEVEGYNYEEEYFEAYAGDFVTAVPKEYEGFVENTSHPNRIPSGVVLEDGTLVLKLYYNREQYTIEYVLNGGSAIRRLTSSYIYGREVYLSRRVEKEGYEFVGWYDNENFEGDIITKIEKGEKGNKVLYAKWKQKELDSETYKINETKKQISQVNPLTTVEKFLSNLNITGNTKVYNLEGKEVSKDKLVGTGYVVKLENETEYQVAVKGDLDGNGIISITDLSMMNQQIIGNRKLSEIVKVAADMDGNEKITITDLSMINQYLLKK